VRYGILYGNLIGICYAEGEGESDANKDANDNGGSGGNQAAPWAREFGDTFDPNKAWEALQNSRKTERTMRNQHDALKKRVDALDEADKTESEKLRGTLEKLTEENNALKQRERERTLTGVVADFAKREGAIYPDDVYALISSQLDIDDDGAPTNAETIIRNLKSSRPMLFEDRNVDQNVQNRQRGNNTDNNMNDMIRRAAGRT
jgi:gas vesicle protein